MGFVGGGGGATGPQGPPGVSSQTPWASDIDGAEHTLNKARQLSTEILQVNADPGIAGASGKTRFVVDTEGAESSGNAGSNLYLHRYADDTSWIGVVLEVLRSTGNIAIGGATPSYPLSVAGDCNVTGQYRVNGTPIAAGAMALLEQHTASSSAELDFTSSISSSYDVYHIELLNIVASSGTPFLWIQCSTDGGATYDSTLGHYEWEEGVYTISTSARAGNNSDVAIGIVNSLPSVQPGFCGDFKLYAPLSANYKVFKGTGGTPQATWLFGGQYLSTTAVNAFRIKCASGNIASGTVRCYGIK